MRVCKTCNKELELSNFYSTKPKNRSKITYNTSCKECVTQTQSILRNSNKEYWLLRARNRTKMMKSKAVNYLGGVCFDCHQKFPDYIYDFHHINPEEKDHTWSLNRSWDRVMLELNKCVLLCANCHRERHFGRENGTRL